MFGSSLSQLHAVRLGIYAPIFYQISVRSFNNQLAFCTSLVLSITEMVAVQLDFSWVFRTFSEQEGYKVTLWLSLIAIVTWKLYA